MTTPPVWDTELSPEQVRHLKPEDKGRRALASLTRKVEMIEAYGRDGLALDIDPPQDRAKLRRWSDPDRQLWPWTDPVVDSSKGKNAALIERFEKALELIAVRRGKRRVQAKQEIEVRDRIIAHLERQNAALIDQVRQLKRLVGTRPAARR